MQYIITLIARHISLSPILIWFSWVSMTFKWIHQNSTGNYNHLSSHKKTYIFCYLHRHLFTFAIMNTSGFNVYLIYLGPKVTLFQQLITFSLQEALEHKISLSKVVECSRLIPPLSWMFFSLTRLSVNYHSNYTYMRPLANLLTSSYIYISTCNEVSRYL